MKVFSIVIGLVVVLLLFLALPAITKGVVSYRTEVLTQSYSVTTGVSETTASVALSHTLWQNSVAYVTNLSSNSTDDSLLSDNYTAASKALNLTGLADNTTRLLSVSYRAGGLDEYPGADEVSTKIPGIVVGLFILIPLAFIVAIFVRK